MKNETPRFRLLARPSRMGIYLPYSGKPILEEGVSDYLSWKEIEGIDKNLKETAKKNKKGLSRGLNLIDYTQKTIFAVGHTLRDYMITKDSHDFTKEIFSPVASEKKYFSQSNIYTKENFQLLDNVNHYIIRVMHVYKNHKNGADNLSDLKDHIDYIDKNLEGDYRF